MKTSTEINEISAALALAQSEMTGAKKSAANPFFKSSYSDLSSVVEAISKPFSAHDIAFFQSVSTTETGMISVVTRLMHKSGQWIESDPLLLPPVKNDPQAFGSAVTYGKRYSLQAAAGVPSVDDDGNAATQAVAPKKKNVNRAKAQPYIKEFETLLEAGDGMGIRQLNDELKEDEVQWKFVWDYFTTEQKNEAKRLMSETQEAA
jgi:hypothetical protein